MKLFCKSDLNFNAIINLPYSKSIFNRLQILEALSNKNIQVKSIPDSDDTIELNTALNTQENAIYLGNGGTTARFAIGYFAAQKSIIDFTASKNLSERPMKDLLLALEQMGVNFSAYSLPFRMDATNFNGGNCNINASESSQFVSSLMLIAPFLENGLSISFQAKPVSFSYIELTKSVLESVGFYVLLDENSCKIDPQKGKAKGVEVESDWTSVSYFLAHLACNPNPNSSLSFTNLYINSAQGDAKQLDFIERFGLSYKIENEVVKFDSNLVLNKDYWEFDFSNSPDLVQTYVVLCMVLNIKFKFYGIETLFRKETNRIYALQTECKKAGFELIQKDNYLEWNGVKSEVEHFPIFETYNDHRMAMSLSLFVYLFTTVKIVNPEVVNKSFPKYWEFMEQLGIVTTDDE